MPKKPYPSQIAPEPPKRPKRIGNGSKIPKPAEMPNRMGPDKGKVIKPYKGPRVTRGGPSSTGPKMRPKPAREVAMGVMGSTEVQAKARQKQALDDMRKRGMLRKKQG